MCKLPGCVAEAIPGRALCPVHAALMADDTHRCDKCHGSGVLRTLLDGNLTMNCPGCGGTGLADFTARPRARRPRQEPVDGRALLRLMDGDGDSRAE